MQWPYRQRKPSRKVDFLRAINHPFKLEASVRSGKVSCSAGINILQCHVLDIMITPQGNSTVYSLLGRKYPIYHS